MESLDLYGNVKNGDGKKSCCKSCGDGHSCESSHKHSFQKNRLLNAMLDPKSDTNIQFPNGYTIPKSIGINKLNSVSLESGQTGSLWIQFNLGQYLIDDKGLDTYDMFEDGLANIGVHPRSNIFHTNVSSQHQGIEKLKVGDYVGSNICKVKSYFNTIRPGPIKIRIDYVGRSDAAAGNVYIGISHSYATLIDDAVKTPPRTTSNGLIADLEYSTLKAIEDCPISHVGSATNSYEIYYIPHDLKTTDFANPKAGIEGIMQRVNILYTGCEQASKICLVTVSANYEAIPNVAFSEVIRGGDCKSSTRQEFEDAVEVITKGGIIRQVKNPYGIEGILTNLNN